MYILFSFDIYLHLHTHVYFKKIPTSQVQEVPFLYLEHLLIKSCLGSQGEAQEQALIKINSKIIIIPFIFYIIISTKLIIN